MWAEYMAARRWQELFLTMYWGAGGVAVYLLGQFLVGPMPQQRQWASWFFAAAVPLLAIGGAAVSRQAMDDHMPVNELEGWCGILGPIFFLLGLSFTMLSLSRVTGIIFGVALTVAIIAFLWAPRQEEDGEGSGSDGLEDTAPGL